MLERLKKYRNIFLIFNIKFSKVLFEKNLKPTDLFYLENNAKMFENKVKTNANNLFLLTTDFLILHTRAVRYKIGLFS